MTTYTITLTERQASILSKATEIYARLGIGQFYDALRVLPTTEAVPDWHDDMLVIRRMLSRHMKHGVDGWGSSLGIFSPEVNDAARVCWDLHQVIRHRMALDYAAAKNLDPSQMYGVQYNEPMRSGKEPLAKIERSV
jgi:hypothetical protein